jgi:GNAT superfamily N-acetyltransferase
MAVTSSYRRKAVGKGMLERILEWFGSRNIDRIELSVVNKNAIANSFWRQNGFRNYEQTLYLGLKE